MPEQFEEVSRARAKTTVRALLSSFSSTQRKTIDAHDLIVACSSHPDIVDAFNAIVECGLRSARQREKNRLETIYRHPVSPSKAVK